VVLYVSKSHKLISPPFPFISTYKLLKILSWRHVFYFTAQVTNTGYYLVMDRGHPLNVGLHTYLIFCQRVTISTVSIIGWYYVMWQIFTWYSANEWPYLLSGLLVDIMSCDRYLPDILLTSDHIYCQDYWLILCHVTDIYLIFCQWVTISTFRIIGWYRCNITPNIIIKVISVKQLNISV
jgi:hypothetical protein